MCVGVTAAEYSIRRSVIIGQTLRVSENLVAITRREDGREIIIETHGSPARRPKRHKPVAGAVVRTAAVVGDGHVGDVVGYLNAERSTPCLFIDVLVVLASGEI